MKPIKVGDLVEVVYPAPCCGCTGELGHIFVVSLIRNEPRGICGHCARSYPMVFACDGPLHKGGFHIFRLRLIAPGASSLQDQEKLQA